MKNQKGTVLIMILLTTAHVFATDQFDFSKVSVFEIILLPLPYS